MSTWVLIVFLTTQSMGAAVTAYDREFSSEETCEQAGRSLAKQAGRFVTAWGCFQK